MLLKSWISCTGVSLKKSSVPLDVKVFIMNMCFCLIRIAKIPEEEIEKTFQSLCQQVKIGIKNVIQSLSPQSVKVDALGHEVRVKEELEVSCYCRSVCCIFLNLWIYICTLLLLLQVWNSMLSENMFVAATLCQDAWTKVCCQAIKERVDRVRIVWNLVYTVCNTCCCG